MILLLSASRAIQRFTFGPPLALREEYSRTSRSGEDKGKLRIYLIHPPPTRPSHSKRKMTIRQSPTGSGVKKMTPLPTELRGLRDHCGVAEASGRLSYKRRLAMRSMLVTRTYSQQVALKVTVPVAAVWM